MISSRADFFFFFALESELEDASFLLVDDAAALRALAPRAELQGGTNKNQMKSMIFTCLITRRSD